MTLAETIRLFEAIASQQPAIHQIVQNDVFRLNGRMDAKYGAFAWTQGVHSGGVDSDEYTYTFTFFYVDRLTEDAYNRCQVQSVGIEVLSDILRALADQGVGVNDYTFTTFSQRFVDECAGVFCNVELTVPVGSLCGEEYLDNEIYLADVNSLYLTDINDNFLQPRQ